MADRPHSWNSTLPVPRERMKRGKPLESGGSLSRVNRKRAKKRRARDFGEKAGWVVTFPCDTCGSLPPVDPSHYPSRGAGGTSADLFPQCNPCHGTMHMKGVVTFLASIGRDAEWLKSRTAYWENRWQELAA